MIAPSAEGAACGHARGRALGRPGGERRLLRDRRGTRRHVAVQHQGTAHHLGRPPQPPQPPPRHAHRLGQPAHDDRVGIILGDRRRAFVAEVQVPIDLVAHHDRAAPPERVRHPSDVPRPERPAGGLDGLMHTTTRVRAESLRRKSSRSRAKPRAAGGGRTPGVRPPSARSPGTPRIPGPAAAPRPLRPPTS